MVLLHNYAVSGGYARCSVVGQILLCPEGLASRDLGFCHDEHAAFLNSEGTPMITGKAFGAR